MKILVTEDDSVLADGIVHALKALEYTVDLAKTGLEADHLLSCIDYRLVVLDLSLPEMDGLEVFRRLRGRKNKTPVLILTARDTLEDRVTGLDLGADDYLPKPFQLRELEARVRALIRRSYFSNEIELTLGPLQLNTRSQQVLLNSQPLDLSAREMAVLKILLSNKGCVVHKQSLLEDLSSLESGLTDNAVEVYISRLRKKLTHPDIQLRTIRGLGYLLETLPHG